MPRGRRSSEQLRREVVAAYRRSGRSLKRLAAEVGVPYSTLANWRQEADRPSGARFVRVTAAEAPAVAALDVMVAGVALPVPAGIGGGKPRAHGYTPWP